MAFVKARGEIRGELDEQADPEDEQARLAGRRRPWRFYLGVLDQLLEDERLRIEAVSGTSAGAMNALALADGIARGWPRGGPRLPGAILVGYQRRRPI